MISNIIMRHCCVAGRTGLANRLTLSNRTAQGVPSWWDRQSCAVRAKWMMSMDKEATGTTSYLRTYVCFSLISVLYLLSFALMRSYALGRYMVLILPRILYFGAHLLIEQGLAASLLFALYSFIFFSTCLNRKSSTFFLSLITTCQMFEVVIFFPEYVFYAADMIQKDNKNKRVKSKYQNRERIVFGSICIVDRRALSPILATNEYTCHPMLAPPLPIATMLSGS